MSQDATHLPSMVRRRRETSGPESRAGEVMTVRTSLDEDALETIASAYGLDLVASVVGIAEGSNETTFLFRTSGQAIIVTLFETNVDALELERAFAVMGQLRQQGFPCPRPIRDLAGNAAIRAAGKLAAAVSYLPGVCGQAGTLERCRDLGRITGQIHNLLPPRPALGASPLRRGHVHGSLRVGNVFFLKDQVSGVINFRLVREDYLAVELADVIVEWTMAPDGGLNMPYAQALLDGYCQARPLDEAELDALPFLVFASSARHFGVTGRFAIPGGPMRALASAHRLRRPERLHSGHPQ